jgi:predicted GNAT superfamily acetyltransferase
MLAIEIKALSSMPELRATESIQKAIWGFHDPDLLSALHMKAMIHAGGLAVGAFAGAELVGFVIAFASFDPRRSQKHGLHSHIAGVLPAYQRQGIGYQLKHFQRDWCLERGIPWITWTFDPLQAGNAKFNLQGLGAVSSRYMLDVYGDLQDDLNAALPTDRLLAFWELAVSKPSFDQELRAIPKAFDISTMAEDLSLGVPAIQVDIPENIRALASAQPQQALAIRLATREVFSHYFACGYQASYFLAGSYILTERV